MCPEQYTTGMVLHHNPHPPYCQGGGSICFSSVLIPPLYICVRAFVVCIIMVAAPSHLMQGRLVNLLFLNTISCLCEGHLRQGSISVQIYFVGTLWSFKELGTWRYQIWLSIIVYRICLSQLDTLEFNWNYWILGVINFHYLWMLWAKSTRWQKKN